MPKNTDHLGFRSLIEPIVICVAAVILAFLTKWGSGFPVEAGKFLLNSFGVVKYWVWHFSIVALSIFALRYFLHRNLTNALTWLVRSYVLYVSMMVFGLGFGVIKPLRNLSIDFFADGFFLNLDRVLHFGFDPWELYAPILNFMPLINIDYFYGVWWFYIAIAMIALGAGFEPNERIRLGLQRMYFAIWGVLGLLIASISMSAGPIYYDQVFEGTNRFSEWLSLANDNGFENTRAFRTSEYLWTIYGNANGKLGGGISAFPSIHVAIAALTMLYAFTINRILGVVGILWLALIQAGSVLLGWHYAVDGYFSIAVVVVLWRIFVPKDARGSRFPLIR